MRRDMDALVGKLVSDPRLSGTKAEFAGVAWAPDDTLAGGSSILGSQLAIALEAALASRELLPDSLSDKGILDRVIKASYRVLKAGVLVAVRLVDRNTGQVLSTVSEFLKPGSLLDMADSSLIPPNAVGARRLLRVVRSLLPEEGADTGLWITTGRGQNAAYHDGEFLTVRVRSDKDCYLRLYHMSGTDEGASALTLLFPNERDPEAFVAAKEIVTFPPAAASVEFRVEAPYGTDMIVAVASDAPFGDTEELETRWEGNAEAHDSESLGDEGTGEGGDEYVTFPNIDEEGAKAILSKGLASVPRRQTEVMPAGDEGSLPVQIPPQVTTGKTRRAVCFFTTLPPREPGE